MLSLNFNSKVKRLCIDLLIYKENIYIKKMGILFLHYLQDKIYSTIERNLQSNGNLVQKREKGGSLRFQVLPLRQKSSNNDSSSNRNDSDGAI